jgi:site-specific recombinase XerD
MATRRSFGAIIRRPGSQRYYVRFQVPGRKPIERVGGPNKDIAAKKLARIHVLMADGVPLDRILHEVFGDALVGRSSLTLRGAFKPYLEDSVGRRKTSTILGYRSIFDSVARQPWSANDLREVDHRAVKAWIATRHQEGTSGPTLNRSLCALSSVFRWAIREGYCETNPISRVQKYSEKGRARETYLTAKEAWALVDAAAEEIRPLLLCALATGMRKGELQKLTWSSVNLEGPFLTIEPENAKTSKARTVRIGSSLLSILRLLAPADKSTHATTLVFRTAAGEPFTDWQIRKRLDPAIESCGAIDASKKPQVTMHVLRHTAASLMVAAGIPLFDVAKILGHSTIAVTMKYAHFAPEAGKAAVEALDRMLRSGAPEGDRVAEGEVRLLADVRQASWLTPAVDLVRSA